MEGHTGLKYKVNISVYTRSPSWKFGVLEFLSLLSTNTGFFFVMPTLVILNHKVG